MGDSIIRRGKHWPVNVNHVPMTGVRREPEMVPVSQLQMGLFRPHLCMGAREPRPRGGSSRRTTREMVELRRGDMTRHHSRPNRTLAMQGGSWRTAPGRAESKQGSRVGQHNWRGRSGQPTGHNAQHRSFQTGTMAGCAVLCEIRSIPSRGTGCEVRLVHPQERIQENSQPRQGLLDPTNG